MQTTMRVTKYNGASFQPGKANGQNKICKPPATTVSTAALRVGLAHFIHEINNPLQQVYWTASMMDKLMPRAHGSGDPSVGKLFQQLKCGLDHLVSLISSLEPQLKILWMINPSYDSVNLNSLIDEILRIDAVRLDTNGIRIDKDAIGELPVIQGDKQLLRHVFLNLFRNALDAMPNGGILTVRAGTRERALWLEISDTGGAIPPDLDAFQPFTTSKPEGLGLGLAITRHIVEIHGGTISYQSELGKGTTFYLTFPQMSETTSARPEAVEDDSSDDHWEPRGDAADG